MINKNTQLGNTKKGEEGEKNFNCNPPFDEGVYWMPMGEVVHNDGPKEFQIPMVWKLFTTTLSHWK